MYSLQLILQGAIDLHRPPLVSSQGACMLGQGFMHACMPARTDGRTRRCLSSSFLPSNWEDTTATSKLAPHLQELLLRLTGEQGWHRTEHAATQSMCRTLQMCRLQSAQHSPC